MVAAPPARAAKSSIGSHRCRDVRDDGSVTDENPATSARSPLELLGALAKADAEIDEHSRLVEIYTMQGLLQHSILENGAEIGTRKVDRIERHVRATIFVPDKHLLIGTNPRIIETGPDIESGQQRA